MEPLFNELVVVRVGTTLDAQATQEPTRSQHALRRLRWQSLLNDEASRRWLTMLSAALGEK